MTWNAPSNTGKPPITDYEVRYRKFEAGASKEIWELWPHGSDNDANDTDRSTKITRRLPGADADPLEPGTQYEVQVRAKNGEGDDTETWSSEAKGTTGPSNSRPEFDKEDAVVKLRVNENTRSGQDVGSAVSASDADSNNLTYSLEGPGKDSFTIVSSSGQIRTMSPVDYETRQSYSVTVKVDDGQKKDNSVAAKSVTIMVDDVPRGSVSARGPDSDWDTRLDEQYTRHVGRASEHWAISHRVRRALPRGRERPHAVGPLRSGQEHDHHGAKGGHALRGAGAGEKRRGLGRLVPLGIRLA